MENWFYDADYLYERIEAGYAAYASEDSEKDFIAWREILNASGPDIFSRRLISLALNEDQAQLLTRRSVKNGDRPVPNWMRLLQDALGSGEEDQGFIDSDRPFARIWAPIASYAVKQIAPLDRRSVSQDAFAKIIRFLHSEVSSLAAESTYSVFNNFRAQGGSFNDFVDLQLHTRCKAIFQRYPALARSISSLISDWINTTSDFFHRLEADEHLLCTAFGIPANELRLSSVTMGLSDRHAGGYQVILAEFGERKVLYKPKEMSLEALLPTINGWLASEGFPTPFRFPLAIDRGDYGWAEWINHQACDSEQEVKRYYRQAGALLCLSHVLNAKDLLFENVVACGSDPVPIDLETFLQPEARTFDQIGKPLDRDHPAYQWKGSVIDIALLPFWQFSSSHPMCDLSGLGCKNEDLPPGKVVEWDSNNSTEMKPVLREVRPYRARNEVRYLGKVQFAADFLKEIEAGFTELHNLLIKKKEAFLNFLSTWSGAKSRLVFRPTQLYSLLIRQSLNSSNLESGIKRSIVFEQLYRPALKSGHLSGDLQHLFDYETEALLRLDIPRFYIPVESVDLDLGPENSIGGFLWASPLGTAKRRIEHASESTLQYHLEVIRASLTRKPKVVSRPLDATEQLQLIRNYADLIYAKGSLDKNSYLWSSPSFEEVQLPEIERLAIYSGELGILIFLAAADRILHRKTPPAFLEHCYAKVASFEFQSAPLGIGNGIGGLIYGSIVLGEILEDGSWTNLATLLSERLRDDHIRAEQEPDILYGVAGLLLALRKLNQVDPSERTRRQATLCMENLVSRFQVDTGWMRPNGDCSLGFAHGTAGIAYALAAGGAILGQGIGLEIANQAMEFDRQFFDENAHNWPATTRNANAQMRAWCSGLTGMLLSRTGIWRQSQNSQLLSEIETNLPHFPALLGLDHWCCGSAGAAEVLMYIAKLLDRKDLMVKARSTIDQSARRALKTVYYRFSPNVGENYCFQPSLFRGLGGIGYTLIRSMESSGLPCILAFE